MQIFLLLKQLAPSFCITTECPSTKIFSLSFLQWAYRAGEGVAGVLLGTPPPRLQMIPKVKKSAKFERFIVLANADPKRVEKLLGNALKSNKIVLPSSGSKIDQSGFTTMWTKL